MTDAQITESKHKGGRMEVLIYIFGAIAAILAILIGVFLYYHKQTPAIWAVFFAIFFTALACCLQWQMWVWKQDESNKSTHELPETELHGYLIPANDPSPQTPCKEQSPPNAVTIFVGTNAAWITDTPVVVLQVLEQNILTLYNTPDGLSVSAKVFSEDGKIVADIENNEFNVNPNNYFKVKRPDRSSLLVYDQQARLVLNVRFLNTTNIKVSGIFDVPNQKPIIIDDEKINRPSNIAGNCFKKKSVVISIGENNNFIGG